MKKPFLSKLLIAFSSILLFGYGLIYACGGGDWFDNWYYNSNFTPETFADNSYSPLFLSGDVFYGIGFDNQHNSRFNDQITADWQSFLKEKMNPEEVKAFLLDNDRKIKVEELYFFFKTGKKNESSIGFASKINLKEPKVKEFITFLYLAQHIESVSVVENNWSYDPVVYKSFTDAATIKEIEHQYTTVKDAFLKNRYWFQTVKAYFYSDDKQKAIEFFNKTAASAPKNTLYYRAVSYLAGIHYKQKNYAVSNYLYSQVFDKCPEMRVVAAYNFHPQENSDWQQSLEMAKTNQEKAALWAIRGYYNDEQEAIAAIFELDSKSEHLNYLLTRLINNQENKISADYQKNTVAENKKEQRAKLNQSVLALVDKIASSDAVDKPYSWKMALGYLQSLNGDYEKADKMYTASEKDLPGTVLASSQLRLLRFVNNLNKISKIDSKSEQTLLSDLKWLYEELPEKNIENFRFYNASNWSRQYLSALYKAQKNVVMAELFSQSTAYYSGNSGNSFYDDEKNLLAMKSFLQKTDKTQMEQIAERIYNLKGRDIANFQAVKATFENKIPQAIAYMKETDSIQHYVLLGNPFNGNIKDCHDCEHAAYQKRKFTQMDFLNLINEMQHKVAKNEDVYNNSLLLGNAFYNLSHFGNARTFYEISIVGYGSSPTYFRDAMKRMIIDCSVSKMYYQKALLAATTKEQKAKCTYMLAKCERNDFYNQRYYFQNKNYWEVYDDKVNFLAWNGFKTLEKDYSDTQYYQDVIRECGYFNTYVNQ